MISVGKKLCVIFVVEIIFGETGGLAMKADLTLR